MALEPDTAPVFVSPAAAAPGGAPAPAVRQRRGWFRRMYSPVEAEQGSMAQPAEEEEEEDDGKESKKPRAGARRGWLRRLLPREYALGRRWKLSGAAPSRLAAGLRWKRVSSGLSVGGSGGCASALLHAVAFRVMYVVEAVVLGLALLLLLLLRLPYIAPDSTGPSAFCMRQQTSFLCSHLLITDESCDFPESTLIAILRAFRFLRRCKFLHYLYEDKFSSGRSSSPLLSFECSWMKTRAAPWTELLTHLFPATRRGPDLACTLLSVPRCGSAWAWINHGSNRI